MKKLILFSVVCSFITIRAMEIPQERSEVTCPNLDTLPTELILHTVMMGNTLEEMIRNINMLTKVNKSLNEVLNDPDNFQLMIKELSVRFKDHIDQKTCYGLYEGGKRYVAFRLGTQAVKEWLKRKYDLIYAIWNNDYEKAHKLFDAGFELKDLEPNLIKNCTKGCLKYLHSLESVAKTIQLLLDKGADINEQNRLESMMTPLMQAIVSFEDKDEPFELMQFLIDHGADINTLCDDVGFTALTMARDECRHFRKEQMVKLLEDNLIKNEQ